jgi:hypothetical protein
VSCNIVEKELNELTVAKLFLVLDSLMMSVFMVALALLIIIIIIFIEFFHDICNMILDFLDFGFHLPVKKKKFYENNQNVF